MVEVPPTSGRNTLTRQGRLHPGIATIDAHRARKGVTATRRSMLTVMLLATAGCALDDGRTAAPSAAQLGCASGAENWSRTELYFGLSRSGGPAISDADFQGFVDREVTPRFPDGLTLFSAAGQWRGEDGIVVREGSKMLVLLHPGTPDADRELDQIREAYKAQFEQESVLRVDGASCVSF